MTTLRDIVNEQLSFKDSKVKEAYSEYRINTIRMNWEHSSIPII